MQKLCDRIIDEARSEAAAIIAKAHSEADEELERAKADAAKQAEEFLTRARAAAERERQSRLSMAQLELRNQELALKQELISAVFDEALERLKAMTPQEYARLVCSVVLDLAPKGEMELIVAEADRGRVDEAIVDALNTELRAKGLGAVKFGGYTDSIEVGFILREGDVAYNLSFADIILDLRDTMEAEVAAVLFQA